MFLAHMGAPMVIGNEWCEIDGTLDFLEQFYGPQRPFSRIIVPGGPLALREDSLYLAEVFRSADILVKTYHPKDLYFIGNKGQENADVISLIGGFFSDKRLQKISNLNLGIRLRPKEDSYLERGTAVIVGCSDPRLVNTALPALHKEVQEVLQIQDESVPFRPLLFHIAGGAQQLARNSGMFENFRAWIASCLKKGNPIRTIALSTHTRCGSYAAEAPAGVDGMTSPWQLEQQRKDLYEIASWLSDLFPKTIITSHIMHLSPDHGFDNLEQRPMVLG